MNLGLSEFEVPMGTSMWKCPRGNRIYRSKGEREVGSINIIRYVELGNG